MIYRLVPWLLTVAFWIIVILILMHLFASGTAVDLGDHCYDRC